MSTLFTRGVILTLLGAVTIIDAMLYLHYYLSNELIDDGNKLQNKLFGPQPLLVITIIIYILLLIYHSYLFMTFGESAITTGIIKGSLKDKCPDYTTFKKKITKHVKNLKDTIIQ